MIFYCTFKNIILMIVSELLSFEYFLRAIVHDNYRITDIIDKYGLKITVINIDLSTITPTLTIKLTVLFCF